MDLIICLTFGAQITYLLSNSFQTFSPQKIEDFLPFFQFSTRQICHQPPKPVLKYGFVENLVHISYICLVIHFRPFPPQKIEAFLPFFPILYQSCLPLASKTSFNAWLCLTFGAQIIYLLSNLFQCFPPPKNDDFLPFSPIFYLSNLPLASKTSINAWILSKIW